MLPRQVRRRQIRVAAETPKSDCCSKGQAKASVLAKAESCSGDSCKAGKQAAGDCKLCATDRRDSIGQRKLSAQSGNAGQCGRQVRECCDAVKSSSVIDEGMRVLQKCESCKETCKKNAVVVPKLARKPTADNEPT